MHYFCCFESGCDFVVVLDAKREGEEINVKDTGVWWALRQSFYIRNREKSIGGPQVCCAYLKAQNYGVQTRGTFFPSSYIPFFLFSSHSTSVSSLLESRYDIDLQFMEAYRTLRLHFYFFSTPKEIYNFTILLFHCTIFC